MDLLQFARDIILVVAGDGRIREANAAAERAYGWTREELLQHNIRDLRGPGTLDDVPEQMHQAAEQGVLFETVHRRRNGELFPCEVSSQAAVVDGQKVLVSVIRDVSERRRAEQALHAAEERCRLLLESSVDGVMVHSDLSIVYVNAAALRYLGYSRPEELLGRSPLDLVWPEDRSAVRERLSGAASGDLVRGVRLLRAGGREPVTADLLGVRVEFAGKPAVMEVMRDVTERRKLEEQLRHSQKMEAVGRLAGGVAHDFNNLLTAIQGQAELLSSEVQLGTPSHRHALQILRAAGRGATLTRQLLAFSRKQVLQPRVLDLNQIVSGLDGLLRRLIGEDIALAIELAPRLGAIRADAGQLEQVLMNLAVNARDAMPSGGQLTIRTSEQRGEDGRRFAVMEVRDTGHGMDAETRARLFEPFFTTKPRGKGTGLGLATVYGIVTQSGGHLTVESEPDQGASFRVHLPIVDQLADAPPPSHPDPPHRGHETILVVEDDVDVRRFLSEVLAAQGYHVLTAEDGADALRVAVDQGPIELVVTDVIMPRVSGVELADRLAEQATSTRVLFITGYPGDAGVARRGPLLPKPFSVAELTRQVRAVLDA